MPSAEVSAEPLVRPVPSLWSRDVVLLFVATSLLGAVLALLMPVFAQEAYYWTYAQHPDLSYFDHPPMVAWLIWFGTHVLGDGVAGLRLGTWLCTVGTAWVGVLLLRDVGAGKVAVRAWLVLTAGVPILAVTKFFANPDAPLAFFWTLCLWALWHARTGRIWWWVFAGVAAGGALLSKYTGIFLAAGGVIVLLFDPVLRRQLLRPGPWLGVATAALVFQPVLWWNVRNDYASFRFQTAGRMEGAVFGAKWLMQLVAGQVGVLNPLVAMAMAAAMPWLLRRCRREPAILWLLAFGLPLPMFLAFDALWVQVKVNWLIPAYVPLLLAGCLWWQERAGALAPWRRRTLSIGVSIVACGVVLAWIVRFVPQTGGTTWAGWDEIALRAEHWEETVDAGDASEGNMFFFSGDYRDTAQLGRELTAMASNMPGGHHLETVMSAQSVLGNPALMYDWWCDAREHLGEDAVFVLPRPSERAILLDEVRGRFEAVERVESVQIQRLWWTVMDADIFVCRKYRGPLSVKRRW